MTTTIKFVIISVSIAVVLVGGIIVLLVSTPRFTVAHPYATPEAVVDAYVAALAAADHAQIAAIIAPKHDAAAAIDEKIRLYGGVPLEHLQLSYKPTESPYTVRAYLHADVVNADGSTRVVDDLLYLQRQGQRWFLVLGITTEMPVIP